MLLLLAAEGQAPEASSAECLMEAKSTYALRSADPGLSRMLTNLCFLIACTNVMVIKLSREHGESVSKNILCINQQTKEKFIKQILGHQRRHSDKHKTHHLPTLG